jgi:ABC-2 type transport system ATP-binding protein
MPATHPLAVEARGLTRSFGTVRAVDGIDLAIPVGGVYGVLGPNGAGKTTTLRMLATLLPPDDGEVTVLGHDLRHAADRVRGLISLTGQFASVDEDLTGAENLVLVARLLGFGRREAARRAAELLEAFGLGDAASRQVKRFSGGMRRRLDIAASMVVTPELLFLDEPTTGLDPRSRGQVWDIVRGLVAGGTTVLLTTQYLDEADRLADRLAVIDHGRVIAEGTTGDLKRSVGAGALHLRVADPARRADAAELLARVLEVEVQVDGDPTALATRVSDPAQVAHALVTLSTAGIVVSEHALGRPSLDEVFLALTGRPAVADASPAATPERGTGVATHASQEAAATEEDAA